MNKKILILLNYKKGHGGITGEIEQLHDDLKNEGYSIEIISTLGIKNKILNFYYAFKKAREVSVILGVGCAYFGMIPMIYASIISFFLKKKVIYNFHDGLIELFLKRYLFIPKYFLKMYPVVVASEFLADTFRKNNFNSVFIPNHFNFSKNFPKRTYPFSWNKKILWSRAFYEIYRPHFALNSAMNVIKKDKAAEFYFFGKGPLLHECRKKYSDARIHFIPFIEREEFLKNYQNFSIYINTSKYDNCPLSIVEAGYYKLLVISTQAGGISTLYGDDELVFCNNENQLTNIILNVLENPMHYEDYRNRLHERILKFTWPDVREKWLNLLN